ncbi:MAG: hypothetical protein JO306_03315 [Gemmatimonadetes bacterium]|nr:hypothetical protein [Gemmatimonadota bacterium]
MTSDAGELPEAIAAGAWAERARVALRATRPCGAALLALRGRAGAAAEEGDQLKTAIDLAAEGWVAGYLLGSFPGDAVLGEEGYERGGGTWDLPAAFWTVDALDGTRSFVEGFPGFCVQAAWIQAGAVRVGVVCEPVADAVYLAAERCGAWKQVGAGPWSRLSIADARGGWPAAPRFVDSTPPAGPVGELVARHGGVFVECGSIGLKICRVADGSAHVFAKRLRFKLWDVAPGELVLAEAGGSLGVWSGRPIDYGGRTIYYQDLLAAGSSLFAAAAAELRPAAETDGPGSASVPRTSS